MFKSSLFFQMSLDTKDQREREISEYRHLLEELEKWLQGINLTLNTNLLPENLEEQITVHEVFNLPKSKIVLTLTFMCLNLVYLSCLTLCYSYTCPSTYPVEEGPKNN